MLVGEKLSALAQAGEGDVAGKVDAEHGRSRRDAGDVQTAGAHGLDLGGIGFGPIPFHFLAGLLGEIGHELGEHVLVDRRVLDRRV